jgi:hypothetical protein
MDLRIGTWNVRSMYRAGSLRTVAEEVSKYKLDLVGVQEVRWDGGGTEPAGQYTFFYGKGNQNHEMGWYGLDRFGSGEGPVESSWEHGDEPSGSLKCGEVPEWLHNW